jgi:agmatinase
MNTQQYAFIGCDGDFEDSDVVIFGVPFDGTTSFRPGTRFAPAAIRTESFGIETYSPYLDKDLADFNVFDMGDLEVPANNAAVTLDEIQNTVREILDNEKIPVMLGGEHLVTLGAIREIAERHPGIVIIHFDAHADLRENYLGDKLSHACVMRRCFELGAEICSFGIRSGDKSEFEFANDFTYMRKFDFKTLELVCKQYKNVYLSIDLDVLDPAAFPGTGTPEAGGVTFNDLNTAIQTVSKYCNIVGADLVELSPHYDHSGSSTALACKVLRELLINIHFEN